MEKSVICGVVALTAFMLKMVNGNLTERHEANNNINKNSRNVRLQPEKREAHTQSKKELA